MMKRTGDGGDTPVPNGVVLRIRIVTPKDALRSELLSVISKGLHAIAYRSVHARGARVEALVQYLARGRRAFRACAHLHLVWFICARGKDVKPRG